MADLSQGNYLDGPAFIAWLQTEIDWAEVNLRLSAAHRKRLERWCEGRQASMLKVDEVLIALGLHLAWVPAELVCCYDNGRCKRAA